MNAVLLFFLVVFAWGTGPIAVAFLVAASDPEPLVAYRFAIAAAVLLVWCRVRGLGLRFGPRDHLFLALQGVLLCSLNEVLWWASVARVEVSGLVPLALTLITVMNVVLGAVFLGLPMRRRALLGAAMGIAGIAMVFWRELSAFDLASAGLIGLGLALAGAVLASFGSIAAARNQRAAIPVLQGAAISMAYGTVSTLVVALALGRDFRRGLDARVRRRLRLGHLGDHRLWHDRLHRADRPPRPRPRRLRPRRGAGPRARRLDRLRELHLDAARRIGHRACAGREHYRLEETARARTGNQREEP